MLLGPRLQLFAATAVVAIAIACSATSPKASASGPLARGTWGGDSGGLIVDDTSAHLHVGCTFGDIAGLVTLDSAGRFDMPGTYMLRAYPVAVGPAVPARFVGRLVGATLTITATIDDTVARRTVVRGPVRVRLGVEPRLEPCPICRRPNAR